MDISCAFVVTRFGDVIISKDYRFDGALALAGPDFRRRLLNELDDDDDDNDEEDDDANRLPDDEVSRDCVKLSGEIKRRRGA